MGVAALFRLSTSSEMKRDVTTTCRRQGLPGVTCGVTGHAQLAHVTRATSADEEHCAVYVNLNIYIAGGGTHQVTVQHLLKT